MCSDCAAENILMDGSNLYKDGWHPMNPWQARDGGDLVLTRKRSEAEIKYYFIDFGLSTEFPPEVHECLVTGQKGRIEAPEQNSGLPYNPFKLDVYCLGQVYRRKIVDVCLIKYRIPLETNLFFVGIQGIRTIGRSRPIDDKARSERPSKRAGGVDDLG